MKKISLILLGVFGLLFSTNVYAVSSTVRSMPFDSMSVTDSNYYSGGYGTEVTFVPNWLSPWSPCQLGVQFADVCNSEGKRYYKYTDSSGFGHYSDGSNIPYYRSNSHQLEFYKYTEVTVDPNTGNTTVDLWLNNSRRIDFHSEGFLCYGNGQCSSSMSDYVFRYDFQIRLDFSSRNNSGDAPLTDSIKKKIFSGFWVATATPSGATCFSEYNESIYTVNVSCSGQVTKSFDFYIELRNIKDSSSFVGGATNYEYYVELSFTEATLMLIDTGRIEDLVMEDSPNGNVFNDYYKKIEIESNSFFSRFDNFDFNGLSNVILAPLQFVRSLSSPYFDTQYTGVNPYSCILDPLHKNISIFNHSICIPSGAIFWNRGRDIMSFANERMLIQFRYVWNILFGGFIIYLLCVKLFKVCVDALDPHKERIENL